MKQKLVMEVDIDEFDQTPFKVGDYVLDKQQDRELTVVEILEGPMTTNFTVEEIRDKIGHYDEHNFWADRVTWLLDLLEAKERLLVCYRLGHRPSEKLLRELERLRS